MKGSKHCNGGSAVYIQSRKRFFADLTVKRMKPCSALVLLLKACECYLMRWADFRRGISAGVGEMKGTAVMFLRIEI